MKTPFLLILLLATSITVNAQSVSSNTWPITLLGGQKSFVFSKDMLLNDPVLHIAEAYKNIHIVSFGISYLPPGGSNNLIGPYVIHGNTMNTGNAATILQKAAPGGKIFLEEITVKSDDAGALPRKLNNVIIKIE